ncbi:MAG: putative ribonuclease [Actinomycetota bacterium]|jgi:ribonuclease D
MASTQGDSFDWVADDSELQALVDRLSSVDEYALDTEFHRERTYFPRLALMQFAWREAGRQHIALVDPLACDVTSLRPLIDSDRLILFHAAQQDLDVLSHAVGVIPRHLHDTQIAAGFLGYSSPSLANLVNAELKTNLPKGDRLTDWLRRPLTEAQCRYAASDVEFLFDIRDRQRERLTERGRLAWADDACRELLTRRVGPLDPSLAWTRIKDVRTMRPRTRGVLAALAAWREARAMASDIPPRQVLADLALQGIAQREPSTIEELAQARGVDDRHVRGGFAAEILDAVRRGRETPLELPPSDGDDLDRSLRPAVTLVSAWVSEVARREEIDPALLGTRADIVDFLRGAEGARLGTGWRHDLVGWQLGDIVGGRAALAFDGRGGLLLQPVSPI